MLVDRISLTSRDPFIWCLCCIISEMEKENSTAKPPRGKSLSLKWTCVTNNTNESAKKMKELDERSNFDITLDELSAWQKGECPLNATKSTEWVLRNFE